MDKHMKIHWDSLFHNGWTLYAAASKRGLCCLTLPNESFDVVDEFLRRSFPEATLEKNSEWMQPYLTELKEYLEGKRYDFTVAVDLRGTPFQLSVWEALSKIQHGQSVTYTQIAESIGRPTAVRAVGAAIGANPIPFVIPCHRVIGKNGNLTGYRGGLEVKSALLQLEGIRLA